MSTARPTVREEDIVAGLRELGVVPGDLLLVHSSLRSFGYVVGGADPVVDALRAAVGPEGTVLVPTLSFALLRQQPPCRFSVREMPSESGRITEIFRQRREAQRSLHPVSSAAASGPHASSLTAAHPDTPCGPGSPYYRLWQLQGKVIFFGAPFSANTLFHCAEEMVHPSYLGYTTILDVTVVLPDGSERQVTVRRYDCIDRGVRRYLRNMEPLFRAQGLIRETTIGACRASLLAAEDDVRASIALLKRDPDYILKPLEDTQAAASLTSVRLAR